MTEEMNGVNERLAKKMADAALVRIAEGLGSGEVVSVDAVSILIAIGNDLCDENEILKEELKRHHDGPNR